jgi:hypothetical protein
MFVDFLEKKIRHGLFAKTIVVFLNSPCREMPENVRKSRLRTKTMPRKKIGW